MYVYPFGKLCIQWVCILVKRNYAPTYTQDNPDAIDQAVLESLDPSFNFLHHYEVLSCIPFNPEDKLVQSTVRAKHSKTVFETAKGAPQVIVAMCKGADETQVNKVIKEYADVGLRAIGVAKKLKGKKWEFLGLISIYDPPRFDTAGKGSLHMYNIN